MTNPYMVPAIDNTPTFDDPNRLRFWSLNTYRPLNGSTHLQVIINPKHSIVANTRIGFQAVYPEAGTVLNPLQDHMLITGHHTIEKIFMMLAYLDIYTRL